MSILKPVYKAYEWYISRNLTPENMPKHVAIIMDGNRRFSKIQGNIGAIEGHKKGCRHIREIFRLVCRSLKLKSLQFTHFLLKTLTALKMRLED